MIAPLIIGITLVIAGYLLAFRGKTWLMAGIWIFWNLEQATSKKQKIMKNWFGSVIVIMGMSFVVFGLSGQQVAPYLGATILLAYVFLALLIGALILNWPLIRKTE